MLNNEIEIQEAVIKKLTEHGISPFSVIFTYESSNVEGGLLSITVYLESELDELLDIIEYRSQCDKTGFTLLPETNTLIVTGMALINLYLKL